MIRVHQKDAIQSKWDRRKGVTPATLRQRHRFDCLHLTKPVQPCANRNDPTHRAENHNSATKEAENGEPQPQNKRGTQDKLLKSLEVVYADWKESP